MFTMSVFLSISIFELKEGCVFETVSCSPGWPVVHYVLKASLENSWSSWFYPPPVLGLQEWDTTLSNKKPLADSPSPEAQAGSVDYVRDLEHSPNQGCGGGESPVQGMLGSGCQTCACFLHPPHPTYWHRSFTKSFKCKEQNDAYTVYQLRGKYSQLGMHTHTQAQENT